MTMLAAAVRFANPMQQLVNDINRIVGPQNLRALFIPQPSDGPASQDRAVPSRVWTHGALPGGGRYTKQGQGWLLSFDGSSQYLTCPDADDLSFGNGTVDSPFSVFSVANVTDTAAQRNLICKFGNPANEWNFFVDASDKLTLQLADQSVPAFPGGASTSVISQGSLRTFAGAYNGGGGSTAGNGVLLYQDGAAIAVTAVNDVSYVAMENGTKLGTIGANNAGANTFFPGQIGLVLLSAGVLTAAQVADLDRLSRRYLGI